MGEEKYISLDAAIKAVREFFSGSEYWDETQEYTADTVVAILNEVPFVTNVGMVRVDGKTFIFQNDKMRKA